ncbi:MAG: hypothetical protein QGF59_06585, partial [Pirellulaceae bacterium]|jgi:hypothetical protein|nr:hypothetical protein [Pirellulaceae bacterium]
MVTGSVPFTGDSEWEVLQKHEKEAVIIPPAVSPRIAGVIRRAMAKKPEDRFESIDDLLAALSGTVTPGGTASSLGGQDVPPPLPTHRPPRTPLPQHIEKNLDAIGELLEEEGGETAERARKNWQGRPSAADSDDDSAQFNGDSFYTDFEQRPRPSGKAPRANQGRRRGPAAAGSSWTKPFRWLLAAIGSVFSMIIDLLGNIFQNLLRYAVVLLISAGLALSVVYLINGPLF